MTRTIKVIGNCAAVMAMLVASSGGAQPMYAQGNRPVMLLAADGLDPCSLGKVVETGPEEAVLVFPGDSTDLDWTGTLAGDSPVWVCETSEETGMVGIVYSDDPTRDCEVASPVDQDRPYLGPCDWGWIKPDLVEVVAG